MAVAAATVLGSALVAQTATAAPASRSIAGTRAAWTSHAHKVGRTAAGKRVNARVYLTPRGGSDALRAEATAVSTPGTAEYHHFLTARQFHARYAPTAASVRAVRAYLVGKGLRVGSVGAYNSYLTVTGTVRDAERAFGTTIYTYRRNGATVQAPAHDVKVASTVAGRVLSVTGLDTSRSLARPTLAGKTQTTPSATQPAGYRNGHPCSTYFGQIPATYEADYKTKLPKFEGKTLSYAVCGYNGAYLRSAYEGTTSLDGTGETVGILDAYQSPTLASDANTYATNNGDGAYAAGQLKQTIFTPFRYTGPAPTGCDQVGWYGEQSLDVEAVHAMAPGANIRYYGARSCYDTDFLDALQYIANQDKIQVLSDSWGEAEAGEDAGQINTYENIFLQDAAEGISVLFSSGDDGDNTAATGYREPDYPASDPYVTGVGGTSTAINGNAAIAGQAGWGTDNYSLSSNGTSWTPTGYLYGAGGGESTLFNQPAYQASVSNNAYRQVPDVAMDADPNTGMLIGETQTFSDGTYYDQYRIGGTSLASPLFAGMTALADQHAGGGAGFLNPVIYANTKDFTDVSGTPFTAGVVRVNFVNGENAKNGLSYSVRTFGDDSSLTVAKGYDEVTGVGVPTTGYLTLLTKGSSAS